MAKIIYIEADGVRHELEVKEGLSVMDGAVRNGVTNIRATCGGICACATCHVLVDPAWTDRTGAPDASEAGMLEFIDEVTPESRLSCQIRISGDLDGLVVRLPEEQI